MKAFTFLCVLAFVAFANGISVREYANDTEMFLRIIQCAQQAVINGIPEIDIPSHNPLLISKNFTQDVPLLENYTLTYALENMYMEGIPWWNVTQMDDLTVDPNIPVFNYTIYWKFISFEGTYRVALTENESGEALLEKESQFGLEIDHLTFSGIFNFSKPDVEGQDPGFNDISLKFHTNETEVHVDDLGILSDVIELVGGFSLTELVNLNLVEAGPGIRDKLNNDWIAKPERIIKMMDVCE